VLVGYTFLTLLIIGMGIVLILKNTISSLERAVNRKDPDEITRALSRGIISKILVMLRRELVNEALDILFFSAKFRDFANIADRLNIDDSRALLVSREPLIISLDVETEIDMEARPREIGLSVFRISDWSEAFRISIPELSSFKERYGVEVRYFLNSLLERFDRIIGHNLYDFDVKVLSKWGVSLSRKLIIDTLALSFLILPEAPSHSLEFLSRMFEISYEPHKPDEDAYASARLLQYLISVASAKGIELRALATIFEPIKGLRDLNVPPVRVNYPPKKEGIEADCLVITPDASRYEVNWYPEVVAAPRPEIEEPEDPPRKLAFTTVRSYVAGGGRDPFKLEELASLLTRKGDPYREYGRTLLSELKMIVREDPVPRTGFAVEHRYFQKLIPRLRRRFRRIRIKGWLIFKAYGTDPVGTLEIVRELADEVVVESLFPPPLEDLRFHCPSRRIKMVFIKKGLDVGVRHTNFLGKLLSSLLASRRRSAVIASNMREEIASDRASSLRRAVSITLIPTNISQLIRRSYELANMGYDIVIFSSANLSRKLRVEQTDLLKGLLEVSWLAGSGLTVLSAWSEVLKDDHISKVKEYLELEPDERFLLRTPFTAFDSIDDAITKVEEIVEEVWGFQIRPYQRKCASRLLSPYCSGHLMTKPLSVIILPTGSGKSLIFQSVARLLRERIGGSTVVISPLLALMRDQVVALRRRGLRVCEISSASTDSIGRCLKGLENGWFDLVYITPEQLRKDNVRRALERAEINYLVIDEIHTMHKWKDFRPSYSFLADYLKKRREEGFWFPLAGFTATITGEGLQDVIDMLTGSSDFELEEIDFRTDYRTGELDYEEIKVIKGPIMRDNLILDVRETESGPNRLKALVNILRELISWAEEISDGRPWIGLIFASFVRSNKWYENAPQIAEYLERELGEPVSYFHGQMSAEDKKKILSVIEEVSKGIRRQPRIVVATKAFGMGVDIPNIRWIVHHMMPESVEDYYQEIGRGGRDGLDAKTVLLYSKSYDFNRRRKLLRMGFIRPELVLNIYERLKRADEGSIVPLILLLPERLLAKRYNEISDMLSNDLFPDDLERIVERAIAVLSSVGVLDYDMTYREVAIIRSGGDLYPAYWIDGKYAVVPREVVGSREFDLIPKQDGRFSIVKGRGMFDGRRVKCIRVNYLSEDVDLSLVSEVIKEEQQRRILSLSFMEQLCEEVSRVSRDKRDCTAKNMIERYLSGSLEELYMDMLRRKEKELVGTFGRGLLFLYNRMLRNEARVKRAKKEEIARVFAALVVLRMIRAGKLPSEIIVAVPYGYKLLVNNSLIQLFEKHRLPPIMPQIMTITRDMVKSPQQVGGILASDDEVLILITSRVMSRFADICYSTGRTVYSLNVI